MRIHQSLAQLGSRLDVLSEEQRILEEQLLFQMDVVEEARTRMLLSETPLAEREYRIARDDFDRMSRERDRIAADMAAIRLDQDRLLDRMLG